MPSPMHVSFRRTDRWLLGLLCCTCTWIAGHAMFLFQETRDVPIDRLLKNFERRLASRTN